MEKNDGSNPQKASRPDKLGPRRAEVLIRAAKCGYAAIG